MLGKIQVDPSLDDFYKLVVEQKETVLVVGPLLWGMRQGEGMERLRPLLRRILWIAAIATLPAMVIQNPELSVFLKVFRRREIWGAWQIGLLQLVVYWPIGYVVASAIGQHRHRRMASI